LVYSAMKGMLEGLDPHSSFMNPDTYKEMQVETKGEFGGLGIEITMKEGILMVVSPIEDTPAFKAGIKAGDIIMKIEGKPTKDMTLMDAVKQMRGPKGTQVIITIAREALPEPKDFTITRDIIAVKSVKTKTLESGYGYVRVAQFQEKTDSDLDKALDKMEGENGGLKGLVLDLRNNPGGLLDQAVKVSDDFLESGLIVYTDSRVGEKLTFSAKKEGTRPNYPIVVLVNAGSASASEIVAGALQDHGRALVLGTQTFGKGSVQTIYPLEDGSALRLTTARYYTPSGRSIQAKGITPDIILEMPSEKTKKVLRLHKDIREKDIDGHLEAPGAKPDKEDKTEIPKEEQAGAQKEEDVEDAQLNRALELLKSWQVFQKTLKKG
ncbi:MAG: S41 family peptidase, partial [Deltaproteobacteria bacterium]